MKVAAIGFTFNAFVLGTVGAVLEPGLGYVAIALAVVMALVAVFLWAELLMTDWDALAKKYENERTDAQAHE